MENANNAEIGRGVLVKATRRLIPLLFIAYVVAYLDRVNVGYAALQMNDDLGLSAAVYGLGAGIFFIGYFVFEVPSNLILERVGARVWIARIMFTWGIISAAMMFVTGPVSFYVLRFLLGVAEAGLFPGVILYLTYWFPARERAKAVALFMAAIPIAGVIGSPLSGILLSYGDGFLGMAGWQFMFLAEGVPAVLLSFIVLKYLPNGPDDARWLTSEERGWLQATLRREEQIKSSDGEYSMRQTFTNGKVWLLTFVYFLLAMSIYGITLWLPLIIEDFSGLGALAVGFLGAIPYMAAAVGMVLFARHSDATGERRLHCAAAALIATVGFVLTGLVGTSPILQLAALTIAAIGILSVFATFWSLPTAFLSGTAAAAGIALINSVGNLGGFVGPYAVGIVRDATGGFYGGLLLLAGSAFVAGLIVFFLRQQPGQEEVEEIAAPTAAQRGT